MTTINCPRCGSTGKASAIYGALEQAPICTDCNSVLYNDPRLRPSNTKEILIRQLHILDKRMNSTDNNSYDLLPEPDLFKLITKKREALLHG